MTQLEVAKKYPEFPKKSTHIGGQTTNYFINIRGQEYY